MSKELAQPPAPPSLPQNRSYETFLKWMVLPEEQKAKMKLPITIEAYKLKYKITQKEINEFYQKPTFADDLIDATIRWAKSQTPEMVQILYRRFKEKKSSHDFNAFLDFIHKTREKKGDGSINLNVFNISDEQYKQIVNREARTYERTTSVPSTSVAKSAT